MRQMVALADKIKRRRIINQYYELAFHAKLHRAEIAPLDQILGVSSEGDKRFDDKTDKILEERAQRILAQKKAMRNV